MYLELHTYHVKVTADGHSEVMVRGRLPPLNLLGLSLFSSHGLVFVLGELGNRLEGGRRRMWFQVDGLKFPGTLNNFAGYSLVEA